MSVPAVRLREANSAPRNPSGRYVLYWMTAARRLHSNFALDPALELCTCSAQTNSSRAIQFIFWGASFSRVDGSCNPPPFFHSVPRSSISVLLTLKPALATMGCRMARYSALLGRRVDVQYRAGDICLPASGTLVGDSGRSIFLEQHFEQRGQQKNFRWEVPYAYIVRIEEHAPSDTSPETSQRVGAAVSAAVPQASAAHASGGPATLLPLPNRPKIA